MTNRVLLRLPSTLLVLVAVMSALRAAPLTEESLLDWEYAGDARFSPGSERLVYTRISTDVETDTYTADLWLIGESGERRLTVDPAADYAPAWSPDGRRIAFLSRRMGVAQVFVLEQGGGDAVQISDIAGGVTAFAWAPDGARLAVLAQARDESADDLPYVTDRLLTRRDGASGYRRPGSPQLAILSAEEPMTVAPLWLTEHEFGAGPPVWSVDGRTVYFSAAWRSEEALALGDTEIYAVAADGSSTARALTGNTGPADSPLPSPDGQWIAWIGFDDSDPPVSYWPAELYVMRPDGSERRSLSRAWTTGVADTMAGDVNPPFGSARRLAWSADSQYLYFTSARDGRVQLMRVDVDEADVRPVTDFDEGEIREFDVARDGTIAALYSRPDFPPQLVTFPPHRAQRGGWRQRTSLNARYLEYPRFAEYEELWVGSFDKTPVQAWLIRPPRFDTRREHPLILYIHGGPHAMYGTNFFHEFQVLAAAGYFVLIANPRGSTGYGATFGNVIQYRYPGDDFRDLMAVVDAVVGRDYIDGDRLGVAGGSGGGLLTTWIVGQTDRFRAASAHRSVTNWLSFVGTTDINRYVTTRWFTDYPWRDPASYLDRSPLMRVDDVETPVQIIHSDADYRTPLEQGLQYYTALRQLGKPAELVVLPGESHGMSRDGTPSRRVQRLRLILDWFERHLGPREATGD
ncbi:MAG: S9 family peptidase [Gammaproteobacteria bacterium]